MVDMKTISRAEFDEIKKDFWNDVPEDFKNLIEMGIYTEDEVIKNCTNFFDIYEIKEGF